MAENNAHPEGDQLSLNVPDSTAGSTAENTAKAPSRPRRRRAGAPAGAPTVSAPAVEPSTEGPRTSVPAQTTVPVQGAAAAKDEEPAAPRRRARRRAGAPAGPPAAPVEKTTEQDEAPTAEATAEETSEENAAPIEAAAETPAEEPEAADVAADAEGDSADEEAEDTDGAEDSSDAIADDLRALASSRPREEDDAQDRERIAQAQADLTSLLFQAPAPVRRRTTIGSEAQPPADEDAESADQTEDSTEDGDEEGTSSRRTRRSRRRGRGRGSRGSRRSTDEAENTEDGEDSETESDAADDSTENGADEDSREGESRSRRARRSRRSRSTEDREDTADSAETDDAEDDTSTEDADTEQGEDEENANGRSSRRRRRRGGRGRRGRGRSGDDADENTSAEEGEDSSEASENDSSQESEDEEASASVGSSSSRRRRRRRRSGSSDCDISSPDDPPNTVVKVREGRDEVKAVKGSTRLEAKKQRRREGRDAGRRRTSITEAEFLARRESVKRSMVVRERPGRTQIAVLEDDVLVEHYVAQKSQTSMVGNVYLGKVQNVLPSMEAAFIDIGRGRNAVLYAGEVNWDAAGLDGQPRRIELALKSGDAVLVQVTKDPIGHKGARLTSQVSLPGRYLVYVPGGSMTGISRKLPDAERSRLKKIMKQIIPDGAGVIVRTAAEGASEEELTRDVERLRNQWEKIEKAQKSKSAPAALSQEPDLAIKVVRDVFNEDFTSLIVEGEKTHEAIHEYVSSVAPDLLERVTAHVGPKDVFAKHRIDEQLLKAMDRKVYLPSGGSLVIDRTEAMTVIDVNTGKFTGSGGSLEETVTKNNLEAAEEIVRQLRLRDIGGIIVVDFIDMVLESNRDLVLRRLVECLGRDRTKHQVAEVTSLGLVQMTRKRVGQGLVETFSHSCEQCNGRGLIMDLDGDSSSSKGGSRGGNGDAGESEGSSRSKRRGGRRSRGGSAKDAVNDLIEQKGSDVHRLAEDESSRALARATIASIAAASTQQSHPEVVVDGRVISVDDTEGTADSATTAKGDGKAAADTKAEAEAQPAAEEKKAPTSEGDAASSEAPAAQSGTETVADTPEEPAPTA